MNESLYSLIYCPYWIFDRKGPLNKPRMLTNITPDNIDEVVKAGFLNLLKYARVTIDVYKRIRRELGIDLQG